MSYSWPGNVRELKNVMERSVLLASGEAIRARDLQLEFREQASSEDDESHLTWKEMERRHVQRALVAERGNVARTAARLGMPKSSLYYKLKTFGLSQMGQD